MHGGKPYETTKIKSTASTLASYPAHQQARGITFSKKHGHVAVSNNVGDITILDYKDLSKRVSQLNRPKEWCEVLVYSPDENYLAAGSHDDSIYIFKIADGQYTLHWAINFVHSSAILAIDWTLDSRYLRAVDQAYAKNYYDNSISEQVGDGPTTLSDPTLWKTCTCKLGWDVNGVFPPGADGTDVNSVDTDANKKLIVAGDDFGSICVYNYPCIKNTHQCRRMTGHSEHVPRARFYKD